MNSSICCRTSSFVSSVAFIFFVLPVISSVSNHFICHCLSLSIQEIDRSPEYLSSNLCFEFTTYVIPLFCVTSYIVSSPETSPSTVRFFPSSPISSSPVLISCDILIVPSHKRMGVFGAKQPLDLLINSPQLGHGLESARISSAVFRSSSLHS